MLFQPRTKVGLVGSTGSGKSTALDLILGLFTNEGTVSSGKVINSSQPSQLAKSIGYVPQQIFLADDTVAANIAFGVEARDINQPAVERG